MYRKRLLALSMAVLLAAMSFAGCSGKTNETEAPKETEAPTSASSETGGDAEQSDDSEKARITMMLIDHNGSPLSAEGSDHVKQMVSDHTNTIIDDDTIRWVPNDVYTEQLGLTLLNKDNMPMILTVNGPVNSTIAQAASAGAFWDLTDYLFDEEKYPNLAQANKSVLEQLTVNGEIIGIYRARPIGRNGIGYRQDWADRLGIAEPETMEDIYNMAYAFTYDDPDGNGIDDTYGFTFSKNMDTLEILQAYFGGGNKWIEKDGELVPSHTTQEYRDGLEWLKKMYDDGLVYEDWAVREASGAQDTVRNGECGMMANVLDDARRVWDYFDNNEIPAVTGDGIASMNLIGALKRDENSEKSILATTGMNGFFAITKAAATEAELEACLRFLDKMCDEEMMLIGDYGVEGVTYEFNAEGNLVTTTDGAPLASLGHNGVNQAIAYIPNEIVAAPIELSLGRILEYAVKEDNIQYAVYNSAAAFLNNSPTYSLNGGNLDEIIQRARTQYICGEIDEAGLEAQYREWENAGGAKVIEEVNAQFKASR